MVETDALRGRLRAAPAPAGPWPEFDPERAGDTPGPLFADWLWRALDEGVVEPQIMTLSTVDAAGRPAARVLVLRGLECDGDACAFRFATDAASAKGVELSARPFAALTWYWPQQGRQIRMVGVVEALGEGAARADFLGRGEASRVAGLAGRMSAALSGPQEWERGRDRARAILAADPDAVPEGHTVYEVRAEEAEFFQLSADRFHRRLRYVFDGGVWTRSQLWP